MGANISESEWVELRAEMRSLTKTVQEGFKNTNAEIASIKKDLESISNWRIAVEAVKGSKKSADKWRDAFLVLLGVFITVIFGVLTIYFSK